MRVDLQPPTSFAGCYEKALGDAVRSVNRPQLNIVYLATHTSRDAETYGIDVPVRMGCEVTSLADRAHTLRAVRTLSPSAPPLATVNVSLPS